MANAEQGEIEGLKTFLRALKQADADTVNELKKASNVIALSLAVKIKLRAKAFSPQAALAMSNIRASKGKLPEVRIGGAKKLTRADGSVVPAGQFSFGADFGSMTGDPQFPRGVKGGHVTWPTVRAERPRIVKEYEEAMERVFKKGFPN